MTAPPVLGILALPGSPPAFVALVQALAAWCEPRGAHPGDRSAVAWLASSPACPDLPGVSATGQPFAVWIDDEQARCRAAALEPSPAVLVTADPDVAAHIPQAALFPENGLDLRAWLPFAPVIRSRWRFRLGLPSTLIVTAHDDAPSMLPDDLLPTAMTLASVVVAGGHRLIEALASAAPCVTDPRSAAALGAAAGDVVVGAPSDLERLAADVAADDGWAAALSAAGRQLVERRVDQHRPARQVARALGLVDRQGHVTTRSTARVLDALGTPATSPLRPRLDALLAVRG